MSALPPSQMAAMRNAASEACEPVEMLEMRWNAVHATAAKVAALAAISPEPAKPHLAALPQMLAEADDEQRRLAARGIEDIEAMMRIGLVALATVDARGQDASAPALALWREFHHAREAVLVALLPFAQAA
ncbi:MAG: hypothetical protein ACX930_13755 [Erythrobacter sp.]